MEKYDDFCKQYLARIEGEAILEEPLAPAQQSLSVIRFHGVAVLSPVLDFEKRKEMQHYRQKAVELEVSKQNKKKTLLNRVHEILDNVQVRKSPSLSDLAVEDAEHSNQSSDSRSKNGFAILPNIISLPALAAQSGPTKVEKTLNISADNDAGLKSAETTLVACTEEKSSPKQNVSPGTTLLQNQGHDCVPNMPLSTLSNTNEESGAPPASEDTADPYIMSLQNLLKRSREYIEREQSRRSVRRGSNRSVNESHSDKENDAIKISDSLKEKVKFIHRSRSCSPVSLDKPSLNKSNVLLQGAPSQMNTSTAGLSNFCKSEIPARSRTPSAVDTESDEELKSHFTVDYDSSIVKSLTGSYAKLPSPEPSLSPKMHRRRPRTFSAGNIVINNPINACDLSPMDKSKTEGNALPGVMKTMNLSDPISNFAFDGTGVFISKGQVLGKCTPETFDSSNLVKSNHGSTQELDVLENKVLHVPPMKEVAEIVTESHLKDQTCTMPLKLHEPHSTVQSPETRNLTVNGLKPNGLLQKVKRSSPMELNKSYDVETPSPILLQRQSSQQQIESRDLCEQFLDDSVEYRVKRRLDLDLDSAHKENNPFAALTVTASEQEKRWLNDERCHTHIRSGYSSRSEALTNESIDEGILKKKMLALEDMRKRLEEQHAQQLSLLIAEQEREQESLQREIEEQERRLKDKKLDASDSPKTAELLMTNGIGLDWRKRNDRSMLEMRWTQADMRHGAIDHSSGSMSVTPQHSFASSGDSSFYLLKSAANGTSAPRPVGRGRTRWSQVFSQDMQRKLNKVSALAKGFLTRRLMQSDKLKQLRKTVKDTAEFMKMFQTEVPMKRGAVSAQDASLQERVLAQLRAALYEIHDIFFVMEASERMGILQHDREVRREKMIRQMEKEKSPRDRVSLSAATQKSLDRKKLLKAVEMGMPNKKTVLKQKTSETRILQPTQGQNAPVNRLISRQGSICRKNPKKEAKCCDNLRRQHSLG